MKQVKNQQGYALLIVLLMVVLFLGLSATFMAGSLSNAKQEQTVDATNQAVASAEMGVKYHSADFQREIMNIKTEIITLTNNELKGLVECFKDGNSNCDSQEKIDVLQNEIDLEMKKKYIERIYHKVNSLKDVENTPFLSEDVHYKVIETKIVDIDAAGNDITQSPGSPMYEKISSLEIELSLIGTSSNITKELVGIFKIDVPDTFLSTENKLTVKTVLVKEGLSYSDITFNKSPEKSCESLKNDIISGVSPLSFNCELEPGKQVADFSNWLKNNGANPNDFTVYVDSFTGNLCGGNKNCNSIEAEMNGINVVINGDDQGEIDDIKNMNNLVNANFIFDGHLKIEQFQNAGELEDSPEEEKSQTIITKELTVTKQMHGQGLENTNLLILGNPGDPAIADGIMNFMGKATIGDKGQVCFDMDRIDKKYWDDLRINVEFKGENSTGQIIYYTKNYVGNEFMLPARGDLNEEQRTKLYVYGTKVYSDFLSSCGVKVTVNDITNIPVPYALDPSFELDVDYNP